MAWREDASFTKVRVAGDLTVVGVVNAPVAVPDATTYTITAANSGKVHLVPNLTADAVFTLPAAAAGLAYTLVYAGVAADAQDWLVDTGADANFFLGGVIHADTDAVGAGIEIVAVAPDGNSNSKLTVLTPHVGTRIDLVCDGTSWYLSGMVASTTAPSFADQ